MGSIPTQKSPKVPNRLRPLFFRILALYNTDSGIRLMASIEAWASVCNLCFIKLSHPWFKLCWLINDNKRTNTLSKKSRKEI